MALTSLTATPMVRVTLWLQLLLVVLILRQSAAVSDQSSKQQEQITYEDILKLRDLRNQNQLRADICEGNLTKQIPILEATARKLKESEAVNSGLEKQLDEYKTKFQQSEADKSGLKKQLEIKNEVLKNNNESQTQLQTTIDGLTKKVESLNQTIQGLRETTENVCQDLFGAAKSGDVNTAKILFKYSNDNCTSDDEYRHTPLLYAAWYGHVEVVRVLLEGGANVDRADAYRSTALHLAAHYGHLDVCRLLLDWGAKVDRLDEWKETPLHWAAWRGHLSVVKLLVERGADVSVKNVRGQTASDLARIWGKKDVADWLDSVKRV